MSGDLLDELRFELRSFSAPSDEPLIAKVGRYADRTLVRMPAVLVSTLGLTVGQLEELGRVLATAQTVSGGFRPVLLVDEAGLAVLSPFGWSMEHHPSETAWLGSSRPGVGWRESVSERVLDMARWYSTKELARFRATDYFASGLEDLSRLTGVGLRAAVPVSEGMKALEAAAFSTWITAHAAATRHIVDGGGARAGVNIEFLPGRGLGVAIVSGLQDERCAAALWAAAGELRWTRVALSPESEQAQLRLDRLLDAVDAVAPRKRCVAVAGAWAEAHIELLPLGRRVSLDTDAPLGEDAMRHRLVAESAKTSIAMGLHD